MSSLYQYVSFFERSNKWRANLSNKSKFSLGGLGPTLSTPLRLTELEAAKDAARRVIRSEPTSLKKAVLKGFLKLRCKAAAVEKLLLQCCGLKEGLKAISILMHAIACAVITSSHILPGLRSVCVHDYANVEVSNVDCLLGRYSRCWALCKKKIRTCSSAPAACKTGSRVQAKGIVKVLYRKTMPVG